MFLIMYVKEKEKEKKENIIKETLSMTDL